MHVLHIFQCTNLGGTEHGALRLMLALREFGHSSEVISLHAAGQFAPKLAEANIPMTALSYRGKFGWRSHALVRKTLRNIRADSLIMHGPTLTGILALGAASIPHRILAVHFHHTGTRPNWAWKQMYSVVRKRFQYFTFCSDYIRHEAEAICPGMRSKCRTIMYPLDVPPLPTPDEKLAARTHLGLPLDVPLIGNAGWLIPRKRFDVFLRVAAEVARRVPHAEFVIVGDGPLRQDLQRLSEELGLARRVHWLGWQMDVSHLYRAIDVLQFNSDWDAMGLTCLEAASFGIPVVASVLNGGLREVLDATYGTILEDHSIDELAAACIELISSDSFARERGLIGRGLVEARCSPHTVASQYDELLRSNAVLC